MTTAWKFTYCRLHMLSLHRGILFARTAGLIHCSTYPFTSPSQRPSALHRTLWAPAACSHELLAASHQLRYPSTTVATAGTSPHFPVPSVGVPLWGGYSRLSTSSCSSSGGSFSADFQPGAPTSAPVSSSLHPLKPLVGLLSPAKQPQPAGVNPGHPHRGAAHVFAGSGTQHSPAAAPGLVPLDPARGEGPSSGPLGPGLGAGPILGLPNCLPTWEERYGVSPNPTLLSHSSPCPGEERTG